MILMFGDTHGQFRHVLPIVKQERPDAIIFLGDLEPQRPLEVELADVLKLTEVWFIHGNHDVDSQAYHDHLFGSALAARNLHGRVVEIAGVRVAGLGGIFRESVWMPVPVEADPVYASYADLQTDLARLVAYHQVSPAKMAGELRKHKSTIFWDTWMELYGQPADILVTHEAPSCHPHGFQVIDALAQSMGVKFSFHGHHHDRLNYSAHEARLGFSAHGVGLRGVTDMYGGMLLAGQMDEQRMGRLKIDDLMNEMSDGLPRADGWED